MKDQRVSLAALSLTLILGLAVALPQGRLLGGEDAKVAEFPYVASLRVNKVHACQAIIISQTQLLTAAHCVSELGAKPISADKLTVRVGSINVLAGGELVDVSAVLIHPSYGNFLHDLAILTLSKPLTFNERVNKIELPEPLEEGEVEEVPANGTPVYVTGWGEQSDGTTNYKLQKSSLNTLSKPHCELQAGYGYDSVLCLARAEKEGICRGDDGGAVVDDNQVLQGIVSFFWGNCGTKYPDISTRIAYYLNWIAANQK
ncbi:hypothetical protein AWZ03_011221 [Drosophila navojoa]|uniref:trypsin n=1 Tax=Drosophila navojoa TaxID=7232 RepID=A0A484B0I0_DRONA|nr:chymotrypsin-1 [Drosophila navojoa]TDG42367.1 hypothetical protein AWZ03_011221 [Drosophila navojoa]